MPRYSLLVFAAIFLASISSLFTIVPRPSFAGKWYMGTATGFDCNLTINAKTLTVQYGGCFGSDPPITVAWHQSGNKVLFDNSALNKTLGSYLRIAGNASKIILVPQAEEGTIHEQGYVRDHCFRPASEKGQGPLSHDLPN